MSLNSLQASEEGVHFIVSRQICLPGPDILQEAPWGMDGPPPYSPVDIEQTLLVRHTHSHAHSLSFKQFDGNFYFTSSKSRLSFRQHSRLPVSQINHYLVITLCTFKSHQASLDLHCAHFKSLTIFCSANSAILNSLFVIIFGPSLWYNLSRHVILMWPIFVKIVS